MRLASTDFATFKELASRLATLDSRIELNSSARAEKDSVIRGVEIRLAQLASNDVSALREALAQSSGAAEAHRTLDVAEAEVAKAARDMHSQRGLLEGAPDEPAVIDGLSVPAKAAVNAMQAEYEALQQDLKQATREQAEAKNTEARLRRELKQIEQGRALPSLGELAEVRIQRQTIWVQLVKAGTAGDAVAFKPLVSDHEQVQGRGDQLADLLREQADQVAKAEERRSQIADLEQSIQELDQRMMAIKSAMGDWGLCWTALWKGAGLLPASPAEMLEWRENWLEFRRRYQHWCEAEERLARRRSLVAEAEKALSRALNTEVRAFAVAFDEVRRAIAKADKDEGMRSALEQQMEEARHQSGQLGVEAERLIKTQQESLREWGEKCRTLQVNTSLSPAVAMDLIEERRALVGNLDAWQTLRAECDQLQSLIKAFEDNAQSLAVSLGMEKKDGEVVAGALWLELQAAREARQTKLRLTSERESFMAKQHSASEAHAAASALLKDLMAQASLQEETDLEPLLAGLENRARLSTERSHLRESLDVLARGENFEEFVAKVQEESPDQLHAEQARLEVEITGLNQQRDEAIKAALEAGQKQMALRQAGDASARHRQNAENLAAALRSDAARYLRLRLATHYLEQQIERFRQQNQAPLMRRASALFQTITLGSFDGLATDFVDDQPVIVGQRQNQAVPVDGMSEGTRDQLFLALRLAAIERHIDSHEPLPLVLDDLLMTFDDARAAAILPVLAELSKKTQILLFTHHSHLVDLMGRTLAKGQFVVHHLGASDTSQNQ